MRSVTSGDTDAHRDLMYRELVLHADGMEDAVNDVRARRTRAEASYLRNLTRAVAGGNLVAFMAKGPAREEAKQRAQDAYDRFVVDGEEATAPPRAIVIVHFEHPDLVKQRFPRSNAALIAAAQRAPGEWNPVCDHEP